MKKPALLTALVLVTGIVRCVGDSTVPDGGGMDATTDVTSDAPLADGGSDGAMEAAPPKCSTFPEGGAPGTLDPDFQAQFYNNIYNSEALTFDATGHIYVVGWDNASSTLCGTRTGANAAYVVKMANNGALDNSFGNADGGAGGALCAVAPGYTNTGIGAATVFQAVASDPDGTMVAVGVARDRCGGAGLPNCEGTKTGTKAVVARFTSAGVLDTTFNPSGPGMPGLLVLDAIPGDRSSANAVAIDTSVSPAAIVVAGMNDTYFGWYSTKAWVTRLNHDGTQDKTFGAAVDGGAPLVDGQNGVYYGVAVVNRDIFVTGQMANLDGGVYSSANGSIRKVLGTGTNAGTFDPSFGGGNPVPVGLGPGNFGTGISVTPLGTSGAVAVAGFADNNGSDPNLQQGAVTGITATGGADINFPTLLLTSADAGPATFSYAYQFGMMTTDCEQRLLVTTTVDVNPSFVSDAGCFPCETKFLEGTVERLLTNGMLDTSFGQGGFAYVGTSFNSSVATSPVEDPVTGRIVIGLRSRGGVNDARLGLVRFFR